MQKQTNKKSGEKLDNIAVLDDSTYITIILQYFFFKPVYFGGWEYYHKLRQTTLQRVMFESVLVLCLKFWEGTVSVGIDHTAMQLFSIILNQLYSW